MRFCLLVRVSDTAAVASTPLEEASLICTSPLAPPSFVSASRSTFCFFSSLSSLSIWSLRTTESSACSSGPQKSYMSSTNGKDTLRRIFDFMPCVPSAALTLVFQKKRTNCTLRAGGSFATLDSPFHSAERPRARLFFSRSSNSAIFMPSFRWFTSAVMLHLSVYTVCLSSNDSDDSAHLRVVTRSTPIIWCSGSVAEDLSVSRKVYMSCE
mmetsp:Transcript_37350/g.71593  ORF Transcript_37350/g.71593 Transcript_37350/m.71593 type:complete len:211 (-) Transcript_37350:757-1389(-)